MEEYLRILGLTAPCTQEQIKVAYRKLAHLHHPDKGGNPEKMKQINSAYQELKKHGDIKAPQQQQRNQFNGFNYGYWQFGGGFNTSSDDLMEAIRRRERDAFNQQANGFAEFIKKQREQDLANLLKNKQRELNFQRITFENGHLKIYY